MAVKYDKPTFFFEMHPNTSQSGASKSGAHCSRELLCICVFGRSIHAFEHVPLYKNVRLALIDILKKSSQQQAAIYCYAPFLLTISCIFYASAGSKLAKSRESETMPNSLRVLSNGSRLSLCRNRFSFVPTCARSSETLLNLQCL